MWLRSFPIFKNLSDHDVSLDIEVKPQFELNLVEPLLFCCGDTQFAHWTLDTLPNFLLSELSEEVSNNILTNELTPYQSNFLGMLSHELSTMHLLQLKSGLLTGLLAVTIGRLQIPRNFSVLRRVALIRAALSRFNENLTYSQPLVESNYRRTCYLSRESTPNPVRIINETTLISTLRAASVEIINPALISPMECLRLLPSFHRFIICMGSANTNFLLYSSISAQLMYIVPSTFQVFDDAVVRGNAVYLLPILHRLQFLYADVLNTDLRSVTSPFFVDPNIVNSALLP